MSRVTSWSPSRSERGTFVATGDRLSDRPEYTCWEAMRQRCCNPRNPRYARYGGRGIRVCSRWDDFLVFFADMGSRPSAEHSLERIDNDRGYEPGNVRWATRQEQQRNIRHNRRIAFRGETLCVAAWAERLGVKVTTIYNRLHRGWSVERTLGETVVPRRRA